MGVKGGRAYYEAAVADDGLCRVGWATAAASLELGTDVRGWGYGGTGKRSHAGRFEDWGRPYGRGDVVGAALDADAGTLSFSVNGQALGEAFQLPPEVKGQARRREGLG